MDQAALIREKIDLVSFLSEYITVKKAGRNYTALCPFHGEKSPSFIISPERQLYHCFGCHKGGDVYTFLMEYEHMDFPEALRFLAKRVGVTLVESTAAMATNSKKEVLYKMNALAADYYHYVLTHLPAGKEARAYLTNRGINDKLINTFKIGLSPQDGTSLAKYLVQKKQFAREDVIEAGLGNMRGSTLMDFFRGRVMFPLIDHRDNVLGFSGRLLDEKTGFGGKYINTRETIIYHKRSHFYGMQVAKEAIRKENHAMLVEGEFDVIRCFEYGIQNVLAVKGTALTEQQVMLLGRYAERVSMCFDGDSAGQEAIKRSLPILEKRQMKTTIILIPSGKDPDEALQTDAVAFKKACKAEKNVYDYLFDAALAKYDPHTPEGKQAIGEALLPIIATIENAIVKEHYLRKISEALKTTQESLQKEMDRLQKKEVTDHPISIIPKSDRSREEVLEEYLTALILQHEQIAVALQKAAEQFALPMPKERVYQKIIHALPAYFATAEQFEQKAFGMFLPNELHEAYNTALLFPLSAFANPEKYLAEIAAIASQLNIVYLKKQLKELMLSMRAADESQLPALQESYSRIAALLKKG